MYFILNVAASIMRMLFWILGIYILIRILSRIFAPFLVKTAAKKMEKRFGRHFDNYHHPPKQKSKQGETVIDKMPSQKTSSNKKVGEYIDFEEID